MVSKHKNSSAKQRKQMMVLYISFLFLLSLGISLMPAGSAMKENTKLMLYFSGTAFWAGIAGTVYMALRINHSRKKNDRLAGRSHTGKQVGLIHFFQNTEAAVADVTMFISMIGFIAAQLWLHVLWVSFVLLALFVFSFGMHCMLNGINYNYIKYKAGRDEES